MKTFFSDNPSVTQHLIPMGTLGTKQFDKLDANDPWHIALRKIHPESRKPFRAMIEKIKGARRNFETLQQSSQESIKASIQIYNVGKKQEDHRTQIKFPRLMVSETRVTTKSSQNILSVSYASQARTKGSPSRQSFRRNREPTIDTMEIREDLLISRDLKPPPAFSNIDIEHLRTSYGLN